MAKQPEQVDESEKRDKKEQIKFNGMIKFAKYRGIDPEEAKLLAENHMRYPETFNKLIIEMAQINAIENGTICVKCSGNIEKAQNELKETTEELEYQQ